MEEKETDENKEYSLPPRSTLFPSEKDRLTRWFYRSLFTVFILLVAFLTAYGLFIRE